jgi:hypothetical protein
VAAVVGETTAVGRLQLVAAVVAVVEIVVVVVDHLQQAAAVEAVTVGRLQLVAAVVAALMLWRRLEAAVVVVAGP